MEILNNLPNELVYEIADYLDYEKYYKPQHYELLKNVVNDIDEMADIMETISPKIARECWGVGYLDNDFEWDPSQEDNYDYTYYYSEEEDDEQPHTASIEEGYLASIEEGYFGGFWYNGWDSDN